MKILSQTMSLCNFYTHDDSFPSFLCCCWQNTLNIFWTFVESRGQFLYGNNVKASCLQSRDFSPFINFLDF